jgi:hypothetical protein
MEAFLIQWTEEQRKLLKEIEFDFHVRAFGEEMAHINFLAPDQRRAKLFAMWEFARAKGVAVQRREERF